MGRLALLLALAAATTGGCSGGDSEGTVTVLAASSLQEAFTTMGRAFGGDVRFSFAASSRLVTQVKEGAPADLLATADEATMRSVTDKGVPFATNRLAIAVARGNPRGVGKLADLARPGLRVVLAAPAVPAGRYAAQALAKAGVTLEPDALEDSVAAAAGRVARGEADAAIVYVTDIAAHAGLHRVAIPAPHNVVAVYPIAVLDRASHKSEARRFVAFVLSADGRRILRQAGFSLP